MVVVIGTTGAGKTKLSVDLSRAVGGEVINADSLQMYKGLSVATAQVTAEEAGEVPHSLVSFLEPWEEYTVTNFRADAMRHVARIVADGGLPVVAGGTGYYVQCLLRPSLLDDLHFSAPADPDTGLLVTNDASPASAAARTTTASAGGATSTPASMLSGRSAGGLPGKRERGESPEPPEGRGPAPATAAELDAAGALFARLCELDPVTARKLHPGNLRRVQAAVKLAESSGVAVSSLSARQRLQAVERLDAAAAGSPEKPLVSIIWVDADRAVLEARLDSRVGSMLRAGLLAETEAVRARVRAAGRDPDTGHLAFSPEFGTAEAEVKRGAIGALIAIGYKELVPYHRHLEALGCSCADHPLAATAPTQGGAAILAPQGRKRPLVAAAGAAESAAARDWSEADGMLRSCVAELQRHTRQYAREQLRWIRRRFHDRGVRLCRVDSTDPARWRQDVMEPALAEVASLRAAAAAAARLRTGGGVDAGEADALLVARHVVPPDTVTAELDAGWAKYRCRVCNALCNGGVEWETHLQSHGHRARLAALRKQGKGMLDMAASLRKRGVDEAALAARVMAVPSFQRIGSEARASLLADLGNGQLASNVFDLPWPCEDGVPAGEVPDASLPAFGRLALQELQGRGDRDR